MRESRERIKSALINSGFGFTFGRTTINLAPADVKKEGPSFDLPIALGMLAASEQMVTDQLENFVAVGELALDGGVRPVKGVLPIALRARDERIAHGLPAALLVELPVQKLVLPLPGRLAEEGGQHALFGNFANAAAFGEIIFNCTLGTASLDALRMAGAENLKGKILIDTSNPLDYSTKLWSLTLCNTDSLGEQIQRVLPHRQMQPRWTEVLRLYLDHKRPAAEFGEGGGMLLYRTEGGTVSAQRMRSTACRPTSHERCFACARRVVASWPLRSRRPSATRWS